jgi:hypothetical protein
MLWAWRRVGVLVKLLMRSLDKMWRCYYFNFFGNGNAGKGGIVRILW